MPTHGVEYPSRHSVQMQLQLEICTVLILLELKSATSFWKWSCFRTFSDCRLLSNFRDRGCGHSQSLVLTFGDCAMFQFGSSAFCVV